MTAGHRSDEELELLHRSGAHTVHGPMVAAVAGEDLSARRLVAAVAARHVDAVTFTTPSGVANFVERARTQGLLDEVRTTLSGPVVTVSIGPTCSLAIMSAGFAPPIEPADERLDAMVHALARHAAQRRRTVRAGVVELWLDATNPVIAGSVVVMGRREREVLDVLAVRPGAVVSKATLCRQVWGRSTGAHTVEVTVGRLRERLASTVGDLLSIDTVARRGYRLVGASSEPQHR